jgi:hypothetical protein
LPEHETDKFVRLVSALIHGGVDPEARMAALMDAYAVLNQLISDRMAEPVAT